MHTNQGAILMDILKTESEYSGTDFDPTTQGSYESGNSGAWRTWHGYPHVSTKGCKNKGRIYTSTYAPGADKKNS